MTKRTKKLLPASWKGIPFYVKNEVMTEGGRRIVLHDYPNSSERYVEDQGQMPPKFSVTAFVSGPDFLDRAAQLERALNEQGKGRLAMPTFGVRKLFALPYRKDASQTGVGEIRFDLEFAAGRATSGPTVADETEQTVYAKGDTARSKIKDAFAVLFSVPTIASNAITGQYDLQQMTDALGTINGAVTNLGDLNTIRDYINNNTPALIRDVGGLTSGIDDLWTTVSSGLSGGAGLESMLDLTRFGAGLSLSLSDITNAYSTVANRTFSVPLWDDTTATRRKRNKNRKAMVNAARVNALICSYEQAADKEYSTETEIENTRYDLEDAHKQIMRVDTDDKDLIQSQPDVRAAVQAVRLAALAVLDRKEQQAYTLTTITNAAPMSAFAQGYQLYAESFTTAEDATTKGLAIRALNPTQPADRLNGTVTVFQS